MLIIENYRPKSTRVLAYTELFESVAKSSLVLENVTFLKAVMEFKSQFEDSVQDQSAITSNSMRDQAQRIFDTYIKASSEEEVYVSTKCALTLQRALEDWSVDAPIVSHKSAQQALLKDAPKKVEIFSAAYKEISMMLHQNIWNKFRAIETQQQMSSTSSTEKASQRIANSIRGLSAPPAIDQNQEHDSIRNGIISFVRNFSFVSLDQSQEHESISNGITSLVRKLSLPTMHVAQEKSPTVSPNDVVHAKPEGINNNVMELLDADEDN